MGRLDISICNAADTTQLRTEESTPDRSDQQLATDLKGPFYLIQALLPLFLKPDSIILSSPGPIVTNAFKKVDPAAGEAMYEESASQGPVKHNGQPVEIAKPAVYHAADESAFIVAQLPLGNGGLGHVAVD